MTQQVVNIGALANDGTGDTLRVAFAKLNANDAELYAASTSPEGLLALLLTVDGPGSGLDADTLDGLDSDAFALTVHTHSISDVTGLTAALAGKLDASSYTAADVLAKLLTVDGAGSGLDADTLDGLSSAAFATASHTHTQAEITGLAASLAAKLDASSYTAADVRSKLLTVDGAGSGIDADLLDGLSSAAFATAVHSHAIADVTGLQDALDDLAAVDATKLDASDYTAADVLAKLLTVDGDGSGLDADLLDGLSSDDFASSEHTHAIADVTGLQAALDAKLPSATYTAADVLAKLLTVDGSGSGLDADLLDGISSAGFLQTSSYEGLTPTWTAAHTFNVTPTVPAQSWTYAKIQNVSATSRVLGRISAGAGTIEELTAANIATLITYTAADVLSKLLTVDGSGSGLDADLLDGLSSAAFLQTSSYEALTPTWSALHTHTANVLYTSANPRIRVLETGLAADTGAWDFNFDGGNFTLRTRTDADGAGVSAIHVQRPSGSTNPKRVFIGQLDADLSGFSTTVGNTANYAVVLTGFDATNNSTYALVSAARPLFTLLKYGASLTSPTQIANNTALHQIGFACYNTDAAAIVTVAAIASTSTELYTATAQGSRLDFSVTPNGSTSRVNALRLAESAILSLDGTAALPSRAFQNDLDTGEYRIGANQYGISCGGTLVMDIATALVAITATTIRLNTTTATTVGAAGGANALPATPLGYLAANVGGTAVKIPYYNN